MDKSILIQAAVLGKTDAIWLPLRKWAGARPGCTHLARKRFVADGIPWVSGGVSATSRVEAQRDLESLADAGLVEVFKSRGGARTVSVRLTDRAEFAIRSLVGMPGLSGAYASLRELQTHTKPEPRYVQDVWIREPLLARVEWGQPKAEAEFQAVEDLMLPALVRRWAVARSDSAGRVYYRLTPAGLSALENPQATTPDTDEWNPTVHRAYDAAFADMVLRLEDPAAWGLVGNRETGYLPLPVSNAGVLLDSIPNPDDA